MDICAVERQKMFCTHGFWAITVIQYKPLSQSIILALKQFQIVSKNEYSVKKIKAASS